jgi:hypothetical protein
MNDANDYAQRKKDLLNSIRTGDLVTDFWGTTWRVKRYDGSPRPSFLCDHVHGPLLRRPDDEPRSKERWVPLANINHRSVQGHGFFTFTGEGDELEMVRYGTEAFTSYADALDALEALRQRMPPTLRVVVNGCGFIKAD